MHHFFFHIQKSQILQNHSQIELFAFPFCFSTRKEKGLWEKVLPWKRPHLPPPIAADLNLLTENLDFQEVIRSRSTHLPRNCLLSENGRNTNRERK